MRQLAFAALAVSALGVGAAAVQIVQVARAPVAVLPMDQPLAAAVVQVAASGAEPAPPVFLPIFGEPVVQETRAVAPAPRPSAPAPLGYDLRGIVVLGGVPRAVLSGAQGEVIVRAGDSLIPGAQVLRVLSDAVEIARGEEIVTLAFAERPVSIAETLPEAVPVTITSQPITDAQVMAFLQDPRAHPTEFASQ